MGVGLNAMDELMGSESAVNNRGAADGLFKVNDPVWGLGANVGLLVEPVAGSRWGVTYLSPVNLDFEDTPILSGLGSELTRVLATPTNLDRALTVPQSVMLSLHQELSSQWVLMADVGWQDWSQFEAVWVGVDTNADGVPGIVRTAND